MCEKRATEENPEPPANDDVVESSDDSSDSDEEVHGPGPAHPAVGTSVNTISGESSSDDDSSDDSDSDDSDDSGTKEEEPCEDLLSNAYKVKPKAPPPLRLEHATTDIQFRPGRNEIAVSTMLGDVHLYEFDEDSTNLKKTYEVHEDAVRRVCFSDDGSEFFSVSKDGDLAVVDVETGDIKELMTDIHKEGAHALQPIDHYLCATGDADGVIKLFDVRAGKCVMEHSCHSDTITSMTVHSDKRLLAVSSSDGTISGYNVRGKRFEAQSEEYKEDITCTSLIRSETKLVAGTNKGMMYLFDWDKFGYHSATFGHPTSSGICAMVAVGDKSVIIGHDDGVLRAVHFFPNRILGVVGQHEETVDRIDVSSNGDFLASTDYEVVRFWNISYLKSVKVTDKEKGDNKIASSKNLPSSRYQDARNFFADMDE